MPFPTPTLDEIAKRTYQAFRANLKGSDAALYPNNVHVSAKVMAGAVYELFSFLNYISRQHIVADADEPFLIKRAADYGLSLHPPAFAEGKVDMTGDANVAIPTAVTLERTDGVQYVIIAGATTNGSGQATVTVRAVEAGKAGNAAAGVGLNLRTPVAQINSEAVVNASGIGLGADTESIESLRARLLFRLRHPPHGGAAGDYIMWLREINGITRVFVDPVTATNGRTTVGVWFLMDETYPNGIPLAADVTYADNYLFALKPAGAVVVIAAPTPVTVNITIDNLAPDTTAVRTAIDLELKAMFRREMRVSTLTNPFTLYRSLISEAIANAVGEHRHTLIAPASDVAYTVGQIPVLGTINYV